VVDMNLKSILAVLVAVLAGTFGGALAYNVATPSAASGPTPTSTTLQPAAETQDVAAGPAEKVVKLRPCKKPAHRVGQKCVTDVTRTVVVPGSARSSAPAPAPATGTATPGDDPSTHDAFDDHGDDQTDDAFDDHGGDDEADDSGNDSLEDQYDDHGGDDSGDDHGDDD
jgi:hypothetical protein